MADFSKEYCEKHDPTMPPDFSIEEEFNKLPDGYYLPIICEGYGFIAISNKGGECFLIFDDGNDRVVDVPLAEVDEFSRKKYGHI